MTLRLRHSDTHPYMMAMMCTIQRPSQNTRQPEDRRYKRITRLAAITLSPAPTVPTLNISGLWLRCLCLRLRPSDNCDNRALVTGYCTVHCSLYRGRLLSLTGLCRCRLGVAPVSVWNKMQYQIVSNNAIVSALETHRNCQWLQLKCQLITHKLYQYRILSFLFLFFLLS